MKSDPNDRETAAKGRYVIVVARTERELYDYLREILAHDEKVEVILDRARRGAKAVGRPGAIAPPGMGHCSATGAYPS